MDFRIHAIRLIDHHNRQHAHTRNIPSGHPANKNSSFARRKAALRTRKIDDNETRSSTEPSGCLPSRHCCLSDFSLGRWPEGFFTHMKTYAEKLKDPRWQEFRKKCFDHHGRTCTECGEDKTRGEHHHIHHKRYFRDLEPWEYSMDDVTVICRECHEEIHEAEQKWRDIIRQSRPSLAFHFTYLADCLAELDEHDIVGVLSRAKVLAQNFKHGGTF